MKKIAKHFKELTKFKTEHKLSMAVHPKASMFPQTVPYGSIIYTYSYHG
jgi:hypothetical protein